VWWSLITVNRAPSSANGLSHSTLDVALATTEILSSVSEEHSHFSRRAGARFCDPAVLAMVAGILTFAGQADDGGE